MFSNILVPLDGSSLSEASLASAALLARKFNSAVMLLHIIEADAPAEIHRERVLGLAGLTRIVPGHGPSFAPDDATPR
jgi:nucleotide-binding universal stress UspA family protein